MSECHGANAAYGVIAECGIVYLNVSCVSLTACDAADCRGQGRVGCDCTLTDGRKRGLEISSLAS